MWGVYCPDLRRIRSVRRSAGRHTVRSLTYALLLFGVNRWASAIVSGDLRFQGTAAVTSTGKSTERESAIFNALLSAAPDWGGRFALLMWIIYNGPRTQITKSLAYICIIYRSTGALTRLGGDLYLL